MLIHYDIWLCIYINTLVHKLMPFKTFIYLNMIYYWGVEFHSCTFHAVTFKKNKFAEESHDFIFDAGLSWNTPAREHRHGWFSSQKAHLWRLLLSSGDWIVLLTVGKVYFQTFDTIFKSVCTVSLQSQSVSYMVHVHAIYWYGFSFCDFWWWSIVLYSVMITQNVYAVSVSVDIGMHRQVHASTLLHYFRCQNMVHEHGCMIKFYFLFIYDLW